MFLSWQHYQDLLLAPLQSLFHNLEESGESDTKFRKKSLGLRLNIFCNVVTLISRILQCYIVNTIGEARMILFNTEWCGLLDLSSRIQAVLEFKRLTKKQYT